MISVNEAAIEQTLLVTLSIKWDVILRTDFLHKQSCDIRYKENWS